DRKHLAVGVKRHAAAGGGGDVVAGIGEVPELDIAVRTRGAQVVAGKVKCHGIDGAGVSSDRAYLVLLEIQKRHGAIDAAEGTPASLLAVSQGQTPPAGFPERAIGCFAGDRVPARHETVGGPNGKFAGLGMKGQGTDAMPLLRKRSDFLAIAGVPDLDLALL